MSITNLADPVNTLKDKNGRKERIIEVKDKRTTSELETAWEYAYSFRGKTTPNGARYIGTVTKGDREYLFYKDTTNKYWYESRNKTIKN